MSFAWSTPKTQITIGSRTKIGSVQQMSIIATRSNPLTIANLVLSNTHREWNLGANDLDDFIIEWGYAGEEYKSIFNGTVYQKPLVNKTIFITGKDGNRSLIDNRLTKTFQYQTAKEIINELVKDLGYSSLDIADDDTEIVRIPLQNSTILQAINQVNYALGVNYEPWADQDGGFHWGARNESTDSVAEFRYGENIIEHSQLADDRYFLKVEGNSLWHSQIITVIDREKNEGNYFIEQVRHSIGYNNEGARTSLWIKAL